VGKKTELKMKYTIGILSVGMAALMMSCDSKERAQLQHRVDSLSAELQASKQVEATMSEVGVLIDSIDASRQALRAEMVEGTSYTDYIKRLKDINQHIVDTRNKVAELEKNVKTAKNSSATALKRLKQDLELRSQEMLALQSEIENMRTENRRLTADVTAKDSTLTNREEVIKLREQDIASLEGLVKDINEQTKVKVANLYYAQAQALETAAQRTKFAPKKKKETKREALELYKLSLSLGKTEAEARIAELEKDLG
jgi:chromosome segregation ATPase